MYCPKCGKENGEGAKYCRICGENLTVVSQAMTRRLPVALGIRLDAYLDRKNELIRRDGIVSGITGFVFLLMGVWGLIQGTAVFTTVGVPLAVALFMFLSCIWNYLVFKRSVSAAPDSAKNNQPLILGESKACDLAQIQNALPSVTESTTRLLDTAEIHPRIDVDESRITGPIEQKTIRVATERLVRNEAEQNRPKLSGSM